MNNILSNKIIELYKSGLTCKEISSDPNIEINNPVEVSSILKMNGIKVKKGNIHRKNLLKVNERYFEHVDSKEKAYWLGFICADGCIRKDGLKMSICLKQTDEEHLEKFKKAIQSEHKISKYSIRDKRTKKEYHHCSIQISSQEFCRHLENLGIGSNKSNYCVLPKIKEKYMEHFLRGLFDGDGTLGRNLNSSPMVKIGSTKEMGIQIKEYLSKKLKMKFNENSLSLVSGNFYSNSIYQPENKMKFLNFIYGSSSLSSRLNRKYDLYLFFKEKLRIEIKKNQNRKPRKIPSPQECYIFNVKNLKGKFIFESLLTEDLKNELNFSTVDSVYKRVRRARESNKNYFKKEDKVIYFDKVLTKKLRLNK